MLGFEWDDNKNESNKLKHKISFEEAITCFYDDYAIVIPDDEPRNVLYCWDVVI